MTRYLDPVGREPREAGPRAKATNRSFRPTHATLAVFALLASHAVLAANVAPEFSPANLVSGQWTWVGGASVENDPGAHGAIGVAAPGNTPSARSGSSSWIDADGRLWLFGGIVRAVSSSDTGYRNDLWKFDPATGLWAWISGLVDQPQLSTYGTKGVASPLNVPGSRSGAAAWTGADGNLWLFGGFDGTGWNEPVNDLWKFDVTTGLWTWVGGTTRPRQLGVYGTKGNAGIDNVPGARSGAVAWTDPAGTLWLFGGIGYGSSGASSSAGSLNDMWRWSPDTERWAWVSGSTDVNQPGIYGVKGVAAADNAPGARSGSSGWSDGKGGLLLFGGIGIPANGSKGRLSDLWRWNVSAQRWLWVSGSNSSMSPSVYGTMGTASSKNSPGAREAAGSWIDGDRNLWLFGGIGLDESLQAADLNDLWKFDASAGLWIWVGGSSSSRQPGTYGTKGFASAYNAPGAREKSVAWTDPSGNFWLFGGSGRAAAGTGSLNDLWVYPNPNAPNPTSCSPTATALCLLGGRFRIEVDWADYGVGKGRGQAGSLTPDTGTFWFSSAANLEVVAKMVSFCGSGSNNVAIYTTGLTDLDVTLHVTDTWSGTTRDYHNPLGSPFSLIRDGPFGCPSAAAPPLPRQAAKPLPDGIAETTSWTALPSPGAACAADATTLCLLGGRFQLQAVYKAYGGEKGKGKAAPLTSDTGTFWFFDANNVEVVAKMVSFCGGGSNNVAIYAGGLTDLEITLNVVDTTTGLTKTYTNQLGTPFQLVRDGPFPCP